MLPESIQLAIVAAQKSRSLDPILLSVAAFVMGFLLGILTTLYVRHSTLSQKHLVNGVGVAILVIWMVSVFGEMRYLEYTTPLYIHLIAGMAAGSILEVQNAVGGVMGVGGNHKKK